MHWHLLVFHDKDMQKAVQDTTRSYKVSVTVCTCTPFECFQLNHAQWQPLQSQFHHKWLHQWQLWCYTSVMTSNCTVWKFGFFLKTVIVYSLSFHVKNIHYVFICFVSKIFWKIIYRYLEHIPECLELPSKTLLPCYYIKGNCLQKFINSHAL